MFSPFDNKEQPILGSELYQRFHLNDELNLNFTILTKNKET